MSARRTTQPWFAPTALLLAALAASASAGEKPEGPALTVEPDLRVELMSLIFRLAGNPEYNRGRVPAYTGAVEKRFGPFRDHEAVAYARQLRRTRGVSYDAVMSMAVHVNDAVSLEPALPLDPRPETLDGRWRPAEAQTFLRLARDFVRDSGFEAFAKEHTPLYRETAKRLRAVIEKHGRLEWFDAFFGARPGASFTLTFGLLNGGGCYGARIRTGESETLFSIMGVWKTDDDGRPDFDASILDTVIHEFIHSYVNPVVDRFASGLEEAGKTIFPLVADRMKRQAYSHWKTMFYESVVRACVVRYLLASEGKARADRQIEEEEKRAFLWMRELSALFDAYEADRETHETLADFFPVIVAFFDDYAPRFVREQQTLEDARPQMVSMTPKNGARDVDPALGAITVVFDRPMRDGSWSMVGGGPHFPEITGKPAYDGDRKTWTVPVKLEPGWDYTFWLNQGRYQAFQSEDGTPLASVHVTFTTGKKR